MAAGVPLFALVRNLVVVGFVYLSLLGLVRLASDSPAPVSSLVRLGFNPHANPSSSTADSPVEISGNTVTAVLSTRPSAVTFNRLANVFNRPAGSVEPSDDIYGPRPHVDTEADLDRLVEACRGSYDGVEKMADVFSCLRYFATGQDKYYRLPAPEARASAQDPRKSEYADPDGQHGNRTAYVAVDRARPTTKDRLGECAGPIVPYHVYWTGPATWRVEVFIKSYLATQNLACSRLWLWIDTDRNADGVNQMLTRDRLFARFLPLVERGDISIHAWKFPSRIALPADTDNSDGIGYYDKPGQADSNGDSAIADGIVRDKSGQQWLILTPRQMTFLPQAISDAVRFVILHAHGGLYLDMDVLLLRDMRPLMLPKEHAFAERWAAHRHPGDFNTAILALSANSSLSSYLLRGGVRMGLNFHPRVIGRMAWKDGRDQELKMFETAAFDPIWTEFNGDRKGRCSVPCITDYSQVFHGTPGAIPREWESYDDAPLENILKPLTDKLDRRDHDDGKSNTADSKATPSAPVASWPVKLDYLPRPGSGEISDLEKTGAIGRYDQSEDKFPPSNRTISNFFKGAWTYHIHNQWLKHPEPSSWLDVLQKSHDRFLLSQSKNVYGEIWAGPEIAPYELWPELV